MIDFDSIQHSITIIAAVEAFLSVSDRLGILGWQKVAKKFPYLTILLLWFQVGKFYLFQITVLEAYFPVFF